MIEVPVSAPSLPPGGRTSPSVVRRGWVRSLRYPSVRTLTIGLAVLVAVGLVLVPIVYLLIQTFFPDSGFTLDTVKDAYTAPGLRSMIWNSFLYAVGSSFVSMLLGTALAYLVARTDAPMKGLLYAAALVPLIIPGVLHTIAWIYLASPQIGSINALVEPVLGKGFLNVFSMKGMIFVEGVHMAPLVFLLMYAAFRNMDPSLEESALMSGASMPRVLMKITLPMVKPALYLGTLVMFIRGISSFEVPALLGAPTGIFVFTSRIYRALNGFPSDYGSAGALSLGLLLILAVFGLMQRKMAKGSKSYQTVSGKGFRPSVVKLGKWRNPVAALVLLYFFVTSVLPLGALMYTSLLGYYRQPSREAFSSMSLKNYKQVLSTPETLGALKNSLILAVSAATIVMLLTAVISWHMVRSKTRTSAAVGTLISLPLGIPGLVLGVALLVTYLRVPIPVYGTLWILLIAYVTVFLPYGSIYASSAMLQISGELEESGYVSGASWWTVFRRVTLPLMMPGLLAGWTYIVLIAIRELGTSLLLYSPGREVLSIKIWNYWNSGQLVQLAALGMVMVAIMLVLVMVARKLGAKIGVQSL
jgi:iron(III) transport system permease protein